MLSEGSSHYDVAIVGGGVVGLSILREATLRGHRCVLLEKEADLLSCASGSNSGIVCTGVDASPGTMERSLIRDSISDIRLFCREMNIPHRECGSLVCKWKCDEHCEASLEGEEAHSTLEDVLAESLDAGDTHARKLSGEEVLELEPNLSQNCLGAVHIPGEIVVDPWLFSIAYASHARENGACILTNFNFDPSTAHFDDGVWWVCERHSHRKITASVLVNAAGLWSDLLQAKLSPRPSWIAKPRRGQYRVYRSRNDTAITHPIQPVPTQKTKGIFVFASLYGQIFVGPTALDQESRVDRSIHDDVSRQLDQIGERILPNLNVDTDYIGDYVGIRPGTDKRDYQIHVDPPKALIAATGIRSTGLTASLGISRYVSNQIKYLIGESSNFDPLSTKTTPLPNLESLVNEFRSREDGCVTIGGNLYKVTHPVTKFGWSSS